MREGKTGREGENEGGRNEEGRGAVLSSVYFHVHASKSDCFYIPLNMLSLKQSPCVHVYM